MSACTASASGLIGQGVMTIIRRVKCQFRLQSARLSDLRRKEWTMKLFDSVELILKHKGSQVYPSVRTPRSTKLSRSWRIGTSGLLPLWTEPDWLA